MLLSLQSSTFLDDIMNEAVIFAFYKLFAVICEQCMFL